MKRSRLVLALTGLALALYVVALPPLPRAAANSALKPLVTFAPKPVQLATVRPGDTSPGESIKIFNEGNAPGTITKVTIASPFFKVSDGCTGQILASGQDCFVVINFTPPKKGKYSKPLQVSVNGIKVVFKVTASGTGSLTAPVISPTPSPTPSPTLAPTPTPAPVAAPTTAGDVLLLGGYATLPVIYDPVSGNSYNSGNSFANGAGGGELPENFQSVALPDGTVLIAGGDDGSSAYANAYIYNPATQTVVPTAPMNSARTQFTLTLLNDGEVLAAAGSSAWVNPTLQDNSLNSAPLASAEIYSPISHTWRIVAPLIAARLGHAATLMPNGTVLVTGGLTSNTLNYVLAEDYEIFTPPAPNSQAEGSWSPVSTSNSPNVARYDHASVLLDDGSVLLVGGMVTIANSVSVTAPFDEHYESGSWVQSKENDPRYDDAMVKLANGDVLIAGGIDSTGNPVDTAEIFSANALIWFPSNGTLQTAASGQSATLMADGRALIAGGTSAVMESYDHSTDQFTPGGSLPSGAFEGAGSAASVVQPAINVMPVGAGPGIASTHAPGYQNIPYASVIVCVAGSTTNCRVVNGIVVDTGSVGLRLFASKLQGAGFSPISVSGGELGECFNFISSVTWGSVASADVYMGGEVAKSVPIQIMDDVGGFFPLPSSCDEVVNGSYSTPLLSNPSAVGANGVLGVGDLPNDSLGDVTYYSCANGGGTCATLQAPATTVLNPVGSIHSDVTGDGSADYNGVAFAMNAVASNGQAADYGNLTLGIGPAANDTAEPGVQVFPANSSGYMEATLDNVTLPAYLDTGTNAYAFDSNPAITQCSGNNAPPNGPWYCPSSTQSETATNKGDNGSPSENMSFLVGNAQQLIQNGAWAEPELAGPISGGIFDWGLPFFYGRTVYVGISSAYLNSANISVQAPFFAY